MIDYAAVELALQAVLAYVVLVTYNGGIDWYGFQAVTGMHFGTVVQQRRWKSQPNAIRIPYRLIQYTILVATTAWMHAQGGGWSIGAEASVVGYAFMNHDWMFHIVGGHLVPGSGWKPLSMRDKQKPWSLHYWPILAFFRLWDVEFEGRGVPYRYETYGRLVGVVLSIIYCFVVAHRVRHALLIDIVPW